MTASLFATLKDMFVNRTICGIGRGDPASITICVAAPAYVTDGTDAHLAHGRDQCRWFGGMVGNHVAGIVARYGAGNGQRGAVPPALSDYIAAREGYDYNQHGKAGNTHTSFVPDEVIDRFCLIGPVETQVARLQHLEGLGVDQFAVYLKHDAKPETLAAYGDKALPAVSVRKAAKGEAESADSAGDPTHHQADGVGRDLPTLEARLAGREPPHN